MRSKNPEYMEEIIAYVDRFYSQTHEYPTCSQIAENTSLQRTAVFNYLVAMHKEGKIEYDGKRIVTPFIKATRSSETRPVGVVGSISCGLPTDAEARLEEYINLPASIADSDGMYLLFASGDSMIGAGIDNGDMVLGRRQETAHDGDIVVAYVEGEGNTLKRQEHREPDGTAQKFDFIVSNPPFNLDFSDYRDTIAADTVRFWAGVPAVPKGIV